MNHFLRYRPDTDKGRRFAHIRYPRHGTTAEHAEQMRAAMPEPDDFEIVEESD